MEGNATIEPNVHHLVLASVGLFVFAISLILGACLVGNVYRPITRDRFEQIITSLPSPVLYHFMPDEHFDTRVDLVAGTAAFRLGSRGSQLGVLGVRAIYFYAGHRPRGARSNHPRAIRRNAALVTLHPATVLNATASARLYYRRWDGAVAVGTGYTGPALGYLRGVTVRAIKSNPTPPRMTPIDQPRS